MRGTDVTNKVRMYRTAVDCALPDNLNISLEKEANLRYGENPNQPAALYKFKGTSLADFTNIRLVKSGKEGLSATNMMDITKALEMLKFFAKPSVAVMKHVNPSGFATQYNNNSLDQIYCAARDADARSAFGSVVVFNKPVDKTTAEAILSTYVECIAAPDYEQNALSLLEQKKTCG